MKFEVRPIATQITFDTKIKNKSERVKFYKNLYGYRDKTHGYTYLKDGLLSEIKHLKPTKSTIILPIKHSKTLKEFFKKHKVEFDEKLVFLNKTEAEELGFKYDNQWQKAYEEIKGNENFRVLVDF